MISQELSNISSQQQIRCYTVASTFEKQNSLRFSLLFGLYKNKQPILSADPSWKNAIDYSFEPGQIFGFACESRGYDFKKFHYVFVLRATHPYDIGSIVPGISPGAEVLLQALNKNTANKLISILKIIDINGKNLSKIKAEKYLYLNQLLYGKISTDYFTGELLDQEKNS